MKYSSQECRNSNVQKSYLALRSFHSVIPLTVYLLVHERPVNKNTFEREQRQRRYLFPLLLPRANEKTYFFDSLNPTTHTSPKNVIIHKCNNYVVCYTKWESFIPSVVKEKKITPTMKTFFTSSRYITDRARLLNIK